MTQAEAKAYLIRASDAASDAVCCEYEYRWAMDGIERIRAMREQKALAPAIAKLKRYARSNHTKREALVRMREDAAARIDRMTDKRAREILRRRYLQRETWEQIGAAIMYDPHYCARLHKKALSAFGSM